MKHHQQKTRSLVFLTTFLFLTSTLFAQQVYQVHEVEQKAEPSGGNSAWFQFVNTNMRVPFRHLIQGLDKTIIIKGVVEPDGSMTNPTILRGVDDPTNLEAIRIVEMYKAWKPGILNGKTVRQEGIVSLKLTVPPLANFDSSRFALITYFDDKFIETNVQKDIRFRAVVPVDSNGIVNADVVYEERMGKKWKSRTIVPFSKKEIWYRLSLPGMQADSVKALSFSVTDEYGANHAGAFVIQQNGKLLSHSEYDGNNKLLSEKKYDLNGLVRTMNVYHDSTYTELAYFENGQLMFGREVANFQGNSSVIDAALLVCWSKEGAPLLYGGNGYWRAPGYATFGEVIFEQGKVVNGKKHGEWTARFGDSTIFYREVYIDGKLKEGQANYKEEKVSYSDLVISPVFKDGVKGLYKFLASQMYFPRSFAPGSSGRMVLSFVVGVNGNVSDLKVEENVGYEFENVPIQAIKKSDGQWTPGAVRGKSVGMKYRMPFNFFTQTQVTRY